MIGIEIDVDISGIERLERKMLKETERIAQRVANLAVDNAVQYSQGMTPGTEYSAEVSAGGTSISARLEATPGSEGSAIWLNIALSGRKAHTVRPVNKKVMIWPAGGRGDAYEGIARKVTRKAIAPASGGDFLRKAMNNAIQRVRRDYGG